MRSHRLFMGLTCVLMISAATQAGGGDGTLLPVFQHAAECYNVPLDLLLVLGEMGSRFEDRGTAPTIEGGYGVMALRANDLGGDSLARAADLTGVDVEQLKADARANILGAAAVLDEYARQEGVTREEIEAWMPAILRYAGLDDPSDQIFAREVYERLLRGFALTNSLGETFTVQPRALRLDPEDIAPPLIIQANPDYPGAIWDPTSCNHSNTNTTKDTVVCHTIEGTAAGAISMMKNNCDAKVSSHYVVSETGTIWQLVPEREIAWHALSYNSRSVGIEHEGYAASPSHPEALYVATGDLIRDICNRWGIPKEKRRLGPGIIGHVDVTECALDGTHTDPGRGWAFDHLIALVNQVSDPFVFIVESRSGGLNYGNYTEIGSFDNSVAKSTVYGTTGGIGTRFAYSGGGNNKAVYRFAPSITGTYKVFVTWPNSTNPTTEARHVVTHAGGSSSFVLDQSSATNPCGRNNWNLLGEFTLHAGTEYSVTQSTMSGLFRTDAVKWMLVTVLINPPIITQHPTGQSVFWGQTATFIVAATGDGPLSYQWQKDENDLSDGGHYSGTSDPTLIISGATTAEAGSYRCTVSNLSGSTPSNAAALVVTGSPADLDMDNDVDQADFGLFQVCLSGSTVPQELEACQRARLDGDSDVDQTDLALFLGCVSGPGVPANQDCMN